MKPPRPRKKTDLDVAAAIIDGTSEIVALLGTDGTLSFLSTSRPVEEVLGYSHRELQSRTLDQILHAEDVELVREAYTYVRATPGARKTIRYRARHRDGHFVQLRSTAVNRLGDPLVRALVVHTAEAVRAAPAWPEGEDTDPVGDRVSFFGALAEAIREKLEKFWDAGQQPAGAAPDRQHDFVVMLAELDRFTMLLGTYGETVINQALLKLTERLRRLLTPPSRLAHLGSGKFAVLLLGESDSDQVKRLTDRVQQAICQVVHVEGQDITATASIGIALSDRRYERAEEVMRDASAALHRARREMGDRRAVFRTQMRVEDTKFVSLVRELHGGLQQRQFLLHYQPIISLKNGTIVGFEALVRWQHPERGLISPTEFIPLAEETGLIVEIGAWVMERACAQMAEWGKLHGNGQLSISVNLSPRQFGEDLRVQVEAVLRATGLSPDRLRLEMTESAVLQNTDAVSRALAMLKLYGVQLSLDDFGTGYASFAYLLNLPFDILKIDRSFVAQIGKEDSKGAIIDAIIMLAHRLGLQVVAEGVETAEQAALVRAMGCDYGQGFYFAKPLPAKDARAFLESWRPWKGA